MDRKKGKRKVCFWTLFILVTMLIFPAAVQGTTFVNAVDPSGYYIITDKTDSFLEQSTYLFANRLYNDGTLLTEATICWSLCPGDNFYVKFYDRNMNEIPNSQYSYYPSPPLTGQDEPVPIPSNTWAAKLFLRTSGIEGIRSIWWKTGKNTNDVVTIFPDPGLNTTGGNVSQASTNSSISVIDPALGEAINNVVSQLNGISSKLDECCQQIKEELEGIKAPLQNINNYLTTPREAEPLQLSMPGINFDTTVPEVIEPYRQPYVYNRPEPTVSTPISSPGPLPYAPDPVIMAHDEPLEADPPFSPQDPITPQEPVSRQQPLTVQQVSMDPPLERQFVSPQTPLTPQQPLERQNPITPEVPLNPQQPLSRQDPLIPDPPLQPQPPLPPQ